MAYKMYDEMMEQPNALRKTFDLEASKLDIEEIIAGIESSKTKQYDPEMYDRLINVVSQSNQKSK